MLIPTAIHAGLCFWIASDWFQWPHQVVTPLVTISPTGSGSQRGTLLWVELLLPLLLWLAPTKTLQKRGSDHFPLPTLCPRCAHLRKSPARTVTITLSKSNKHIQMYTELPTSSYFSRTAWEKKRASSGLLLGHWKIPFLKTQRLCKIYMFLHALPPWHNPKEACAQEAAHLVSSVSWRTGEIEQKSFALTLSFATAISTTHFVITSAGYKSLFVMDQIWKSKSFYSHIFNGIL